MQVFNLKHQYKIKRVAGVWYISVLTGEYKTATTFNFPSLGEMFEIFTIYEPLNNTIN